MSQRASVTVFASFLLAFVATLGPVWAWAAAATGEAPPPPVRAMMQGQVLYDDPALGLFVQVGHETVRVTGAKGGPFAPGDRIEIAGVAGVEDGVRTIANAQTARLGTAPLPEPRSIAIQVLGADLSADSWITFNGVIQEVTKAPHGFNLRVAANEASVVVSVPSTAPEASILVDAEVRIQGVRVLLRNPRGVVRGVRILSPEMTAADVVAPSPGDPFQLPLSSLGEVRKVMASGATPHRIHARGTVLLQHAAVYSAKRIVHVQDHTGAMAFEVGADVDVAAGTVVDVTGFPGTLFQTPLVSAGDLRSVGPGTVVTPMPTTVGDIMASQHLGEMVTIRGSFKQVTRGSNFDLLSVDSGGTIVQAYVYDWPAHGPMPAVRAGSTVDVTGVTAVFYDAVGAPTAMILVMSGPEALVVVAIPSWWTPTRVVTALAVAGGICLLAFLWVGVLKAQVRQQTRALTAQFERTAALQRRWTDLVANASDAILTWDLDGHLTSLNRNGQTILGLSEDEARLRSLHDIVAPEHVALVTGLLRERQNSQDSERIEVDVVCLEGRRTPLELNVQPVFEQRQHVGYQAIARDMTQHKTIQSALREARDAAEDANRAKSEFLANMSHEIRTPMNGVIGMTQLALMTDLSATQRDYLETVNRSAESLLGILNSILDFSKIESRKLEMESVPFELRDLMSDTIKPLTFAAEAKGLELIFDIGPDVPDAILGDPLRLRQVVTNLIGNAVKFTDKGHVLLEVRLDRRSADGVRLHFSVSDTGVGIARDVQPLIFAPFSQADGSTTRRYGGTGLGLAISASLVSLMDGRIWLESEPGEGSTFHFTAGFGADTDGAAGVAGVTAAATRIWDPIPTLIVDDNGVNRRILSEQLGRMGMTSQQADGGTSALRLLTEAASRGTPFRLVLLDVHMPDMDGIDVASHIAARPELAGTTVIMLTSSGRPHDAERCRELNVAAYLNKPIAPAHLFEVMSRLIGRTVETPRDTRNTRDTQDTHNTRDTKRAKARPALAAHLRRRVLLAEDNVVNQRVAVGLLSKRGHEVVVAGTGKEALERLDRDQFDVILMDVQMPELGGLETTGIIRQRESGTGRHIWIVAMTAHTMQGDRDECLAAGMDTYLPKPIDPVALFAAVEEAPPVRNTGVTPTGDALGEFALEGAGEHR